MGMQSAITVFALTVFVAGAYPIAHGAAVALQAIALNPIERSF